MSLGTVSSPESGHNCGAICHRQSGERRFRTGDPKYELNVWFARNHGFAGLGFDAIEGVEGKYSGG